MNLDDFITKRADDTIYTAPVEKSKSSLKPKATKKPQSRNVTPRTKSKRVQVSWTISPEAIAWVEAMAKSENRTPSTMANILMNEYMNKGR